MSVVSASEVAKYIVHFFQECEDPVTNLKLQKLLYYVQGWHLGLFNTPAFADDFQAWVHGPVVPEVFHQYKENRWNPITIEVAKPDLPADLVQHIDEVLEVYGGDTGWALELRTHREKPWLAARTGIAADQPSQAIITKESMQSFFSELAQKEKSTFPVEGICDIARR